MLSRPCSVHGGLQAVTFNRRFWRRVVRRVVLGCPLLPWEMPTELRSLVFHTPGTSSLPPRFCRPVLSMVGRNHPIHTDDYRKHVDNHDGLYLQSVTLKW